jgi:glycosyltransferase involved in cell wall biosynthesis
VQNKPLVSIVITTKNEERNIQTCLDSIKSQSYSNIETIVVDNFSTDRTQEISKRYTEKVFAKGPERSAQRNYGMIAQADGEYVMFVDADMILAPGLIEACVQRMQKGDCHALHIREIVLGVNFWSKVRRFERTFYDGTVVDGARFFLKSAFVAVGGFDEKLFKVGSGEDWDIDKLIKLHGAIILLDGCLQQGQKWNPALFKFLSARGVVPSLVEVLIYHNEADFELIKYLKKKSYYAKGFDGYIQKWGKNDPDIRKQFGLLYRYFGVFLENGKWKQLVLSPILAVGMYILRVQVGIVFIMNKLGINK